MIKRKRGLFITFEGVEGCGKSTQVQLLAEYLTQMKHKVFRTHEPGGTPFGKKIRKLLLHSKEDLTPETETLLYMASRKELVTRVLQPKLKAGYIVLCDRWLDATIAYQSYGSGVRKQWVLEVARDVTDGLHPDLTIWLDLPVKTGLRRACKRAKLDKIEKRSLKFHQSVRSGYVELAKEHTRIKRVVPTSIQNTHLHIRKLIHEIT